MSRTNIAAQTTPGAYATVTPGSQDIVFTPADNGNGNDTALVDGKTLVLAFNDSGGPLNVTFTSVPDSPFNRTGDITAYAVADGKVSQFGPFKSSGWAHTGRLWIDADTGVNLAVITLP